MSSSCWSGPSGCGKSTTLRMIAGLEDITDGDIMIGGDVVNDVPPKDRDIAMVFQNYALYPHMTVAENMSFGLRLKRYPKAEIKTAIDEAARMLDIIELLDRKPKQLSGGQRQRVAMGRAIVRNPKVFSVRRAAVQPRRQAARADADRDQEGASEGAHHHRLRHPRPGRGDDAGADRVVVMNHGRIEQIGTPNELYHKPATQFVAGFIGSPAMNFIPAGWRRSAASCHVRLTDRLAFPLPPARAASVQRRVSPTDKLLLGLRPEHITEAKPHVEPGIEPFDAVLDVTEPMGMETLVYFPMEGAQVCGRVNPNAGAQDGAPLRLADGPQQHAPAKRGDRRRPLTAQSQNQGRGEEWLPTRRRRTVTEIDHHSGKSAACFTPRDDIEIIELPTLDSPEGFRSQAEEHAHRFICVALGGTASASSSFEASEGMCWW